MNKYCNIITAIKIYLEVVLSSLKRFTIFTPPLNRGLVAFLTAARVSKVIFAILLIFNRKTTFDGVFIKLVELTKQPFPLTAQNKGVE